MRLFKSVRKRYNIIMQENSRYAVGIDIGTTQIRAVVGHIDQSTGTPTIVGVGQAPNNGMRKGIIVNLNGPAQTIDVTLGEAERMSGYEVNGATISVNGAHILSTKADGMIAVGMQDHEITAEDLARIEDVATTGKVPANREILEVVPHSYRLDGQDNIKDPLGMKGTRLEIIANVVSGLTPHVDNVRRVAEMATVTPHNLITAGLAAAKAVLNERQIESGVAVIDIGGATTSVSVFEEGDLQYVGIIPVGGVNITNDLAIGLKTDPEIAEKVKINHAAAIARGDGAAVNVEHDGETYSFSIADIDEVVEARLEEIFEAVQDQLRKSGRAGQLPSGVVLTGGTAKMQNIVEFAKRQLNIAARIGKPTGFAGMEENVNQPDFATAVGLMIIDSENDNQPKHKKLGGNKSLKSATGQGLLSRFADKFRA